MIYLVQSLKAEKASWTPEEVMHWQVCQGYTPCPVVARRAVALLKTI